MLINTVSRQTSNYLDPNAAIMPYIEHREVSVSCNTMSASLRSSARQRGTSGHPRVACLSNNLQQGCSFELSTNNSADCFLTDSIPFESIGNEGTSEEEFRPLPPYQSEEECTLADPAYENLAAATPSTCNDVHSMSLTYTSLYGSIRRRWPKDETLKFLSQGGYNSVWRHESLHDNLIMKMHRPSRKFSEIDLDRNRRDVLISGLAGRAPNEYSNNVLPMYQYCGYTLVVPLASQPLDDYVRKYRENHDGQLMGANEMFHLAFQAARGLYQSHLYLDGKATTAHSDVKPSQFLLFETVSHGIQELSSPKIPLLQLNDFNRCRILYRSNSKETCPFRICGVKHKGSTYRSPEEYMECADQSDAIDVFSLGGVIFFLLSDGLEPYFGMDFDKAVDRILKGKLPRLPSIEYYNSFGDGVAANAKRRAKHPAFKALQHILLSCWRFDPKDRPSSLELVRMFESKSAEVFS